MKILVTGGNGFIGRHVVAELESRGFDVRVMSRNPKTEASMGPSTNFVQQDLLESHGLINALEGTDAVIHCSAAMQGDLQSQLAVTVEGTKNLLTAMSETGVRHIIGISTFAIYDYLRLEPGSLLTEDSPLDEHFDSRAPYIRAKRCQEDLIREFAMSNQWRWTILRPGIVYGKGRTWFHQLGLKFGNRRWVSLAGESVLPITHVENCADAIVSSLESDSANESTLNIVDDDLPERQVYLAELARRTSPETRVEVVSWKLLDKASRLAAWTNNTLLFGKAPLPDILQPASLSARCKPLRYSNDRAKHLLSWSPKLDLQEGLNRSF